MAVSTFSDAAQGGLNSGGSGVYSTVRGGNNLGNDNANPASIFNKFDGANYTINRFFLEFNMSSPATGSVIPSNAIVSAIKITFAGAGTTQNTDSDSVAVVSSTMAGDTPVTGDWTNVGAISYGSLALSSWSNVGNNDITFNATGLAAMVFSGKWKLAGRTLNDINNVAPTNPGDAGQFTRTTIVMTVTYTVPSGGAFLENFI